MQSTGKVQIYNVRAGGKCSNSYAVKGCSNVWIMCKSFWGYIYNFFKNSQVNFSFFSSLYCIAMFLFKLSELTLIQSQYHG